MIMFFYPLILIMPKRLYSIQHLVALRRNLRFLARYIFLITFKVSNESLSDTAAQEKQGVKVIESPKV